MKKYVLISRDTSMHFATSSRSAIVEKLTDMESGGLDLDHFIVIEIDSERCPPVNKTAKDWLRPEATAATAETPASPESGRRPFAQAWKKVSDWLIGNR